MIKSQLVAFISKVNPHFSCFHSTGQALRPSRRSSNHLSCIWRLEFPMCEFSLNQCMIGCIIIVQSRLAMNAKFNGLASEKAFLPAYSMVICCVTANITTDILLPYMYSWLWAKLKLCQYKLTMVTRRAQDQVKETLEATFTNNCIYIMAALLFIDAATYHEVCKKKCNYLRRNSRLENGWHISHLRPCRHKCSTFLLHMQWYSSRVAMTLLIRVGTWEGQLQPTLSPKIFFLYISQ